MDIEALTQQTGLRYRAKALQLLDGTNSRCLGRVRKFADEQFEQAMGTVSAVTGKLQLAVHNRLTGSSSTSKHGAKSANGARSFVHLTDASLYEEYNVTVANVARDTKVLWGPVHAPFLVQAKEDMTRLLQVMMVVQI